MTLRWGICGTGNVADLFARTVSGMGGQVVAVASRTPERGQGFGRQHGIAGQHWPEGSWIIEDPEVDALYVATPASVRGVAAAAVRVGKHVLVEKPIALHSSEAEALAVSANLSRVFCMEAMWSRFLPAYDVLRELLDASRIGEVRIVDATFGIAADYRPELRPFRPDLGGGALSDAGPYPVQLAHLVLGEPEQVLASGEMLASGVDGHATMALNYESGAVAYLACAIDLTLANTVRITGTEGAIVLPSTLQPTYVEVYDAVGNMERIDAPMTQDRLAYEIAEVERCVADGLTESPVMPLDESVAIVRTLEQAREQVWG